MLPRKRSMPAEPAANPFALAPRRAQISVSDEITKVKAAPALPPPLPGKPPVPGKLPPRVASSRPPPIPRELPRASMTPPSFAAFDDTALAPTGANVAQLLAEELDAPTSENLPRHNVATVPKKPVSEGSIEPMAITHHPRSSNRPNASWAMALLALGVFGGVVTAIVAGGETDSILRAGATFIDPGGGQSAMHVAAAPLAAAPAAQSPLAPVSTAPARLDDRPATIVGDPVDLGPQKKEIKEAKAEPKAETRIRPFETSRPKAEPKPEPKVAAAPPVRRDPPKARPVVEKPPVEKAPEKVETEEVAAKPSKKKDPMSSAAAADALAKMQLEGSL